MSRTLGVLGMCFCALAAGCVGAGQEGELPEPYMDAVGVLHGLELLPGEQEGRGSRDFCFRFTPDAKQRQWLVISRFSTPFLKFRLGPTYLEFTKDNLADGTRVRVVGVRKVDRMPEAFHGRPLPADATVTALIVAVIRDGTQTPVYVNNWFHPWREGMEGILDPAIAKHYVDREGPFWVCGWLPVDRSPEVPPKKRLEPVRELLDGRLLHELEQKRFDKAVYKGFLVKSQEGHLGYKLKAEQLWVHVGGGDYELLVGAEQGLELLEPPGPGSAERKDATK
jgi:hypothetical protein